jgi:heavy metal sensor kinase
MRSIRVSLLLYFLGLLVVALTVASLLVYRSAQRTLADKEEALRDNVQRQYEDRRREERQRFDDGLLEQAQALAGRLQLEMHWSRMNYIVHAPNADPPVPSVPNALYSLGMLTAALTPSGYVSMAPWLGQVQQKVPERDPSRPPRPGIPPRRIGPYRMLPFAYVLWRHTVVDGFLTKSPIDFPTGARSGFYFQIDVNFDLLGRVSLRSKSMEGLTFPDSERFGSDKVPFYSERDDVELSPGLWVRRVRLKSSRVSVYFPTPGRGRGRGGPPATPMPVVPPAGSGVGLGGPREQREISPLMVLQVAADMSHLNKPLDGLLGERDDELASLKAQTAQALTVLRNRLLAISSVTLGATFLGAWILVWLGLVPLKRMSEAVSKVSPRDFRLPLSESSLPTELRPIAERLAATLDELKRAFAREKQSTADISHELRTPLAALVATADLALRRPRSADQYREFLQECRSSAQQMNQVVERLLTLARLDAGVDRLRPQTFDAADLAEQCAAVVRPLAEAQGLRLMVSKSGSGAEHKGECPTRLTTDPDKLREVLNNLLHNAIQYNRPAGQIDLTVARDNGHVRLEVRDTGIGIAPEAREHIFERFYRADPSRTSDGMNAGLGLAIVKEYVELMGGRIAVDSAPGQGSTFRIELPATPTVSL